MLLSYVFVMLISVLLPPHKELPLALVCFLGFVLNFKEFILT